MIVKYGDKLFGLWYLKGQSQQMLISVVQKPKHWVTEYKLHVDDTDQDETISSEFPVNTSQTEIYERVSSFIEDLITSGFGSELYCKMVISSNPAYIKKVLKEYKFI